MLIYLSRLACQLELDAYTKALLHALNYHCNKNLQCWPSVETLAKESGMSKRNIFRRLKILQDKNIITIIERKNSKGHKMTSIYQINLVIKIDQNGKSEVSIATPVQVTNGHSPGDCQSPFQVTNGHLNYTNINYTNEDLNMSTCKQVLVISEEKPSLDDELVSQDIRPKKPEGIICPHNEIIELYHEILPMCPRVKNWTVARQKLLRARWREKPTRQNLEWWRGYFDYASKSKFLTGLVEATNGRPQFLATLEWLVRPSNLVKVVEGNYHKDLT